MKPVDLIKKAELVFSTFKPSQMTVDSHIEAFLKEHQITDEADALFLQQVAYGCIRYKKLIKVVLSSLYFKHGAEISREDHDFYYIFTYLSVVRLEDLTFPVFKEFVLAHDNQKMSVFLGFLFNEGNLRNWLKDEWSKFYDVHYVEEDLINKLLSFWEMEGLLEQIRPKVGASTRRLDDAPKEGSLQTLVIPKKPATQTKPFNLTKPQPRMVPQPEAIPIGVKANPIPETTFKEPKTLEKIEKIKKQNREEIQMKYANAKAFHLRMNDRPNNIDQVREEVEAKFWAEHEYRQPRARPVPKFNEDRAPVKLNTAAILREDALHKKKQQSEASLLKAYETELRDASTFEKWKAEELAKEDEIRLLEIEKRKKEMMLADELAKEAKAQNIMEKGQVVAEMRSEAIKVKEQNIIESRQAMEEKRDLVQAVIGERDKPRLAEEVVAQQRKEKAAQVLEERKELQQRAAEEKERERQYRMEIVRQIRAMECLPVSREAHFDPSEVAGHDILEEMSLAELRERLALTKMIQAEEEAERREEIIRKKQRKEEELVSKASNIAKIRQQAERENVERRQQVHREEQQRKQKVQAAREQALVELHDRIEAKRTARMLEEEKLAAERKAISIKRQFLAADKEKVEEIKWKSQEKGAERALRDKQSVKVKSTVKQNQIKQQVNVNRERVTKDRVKAREDYLEDYSRRMREAETFQSERAAEDAEIKREMFLEQRVREKELLATQRHDAPYATRINDKIRKEVDNRKARESSRAAHGDTYSRALGSPSAQFGTGFAGIPDSPERVALQSLRVSDES